MELGVARVKLRPAEHGVVEEEPAAEVIDCLFGLRQELIGEECHVIAGFAEHLGEEGIVTPLPLLAHHMEGEHVLEHKTGQIPTGDDIGKFHQQSAVLTRYLSRGGLHEITVLLGMVAPIAFADDEHDVGRTESTTVHRHLVGRSHELIHLPGGERVGIDAEHQPIDRLIEHGMILLGERVLHLANGAAGHQFVNGHLVLGTREHTHHQQSQTHDACHQRRMPPAEACGNHTRERQLAPQSGHSHMDENEQHYPPHPAEQHIDRQARREEVAHLAAIGFSHEHEHRWGERGVVIDKAVDIGQSCDVEDHIEQHFHPCPHLAWYESEQG